MIQQKKSLIDKIQLLGASAIDIIRSLGDAGIFLFMSLIGRRGPGKHFQLLIKQIYFIGVLSLPIIIVSGMFIGMIMALQGYNILVSYASSEAVGQVVALSLLRELGPVVTGLLYAGRAGSALTAEIGNMKSSEQLSGLETFGVDPLKYVVAPRLIAGFISMPLLATIFVVVGIWGGALVAIDWLGVYDGSYWGNMQSNVRFGYDVCNGFIKSLVFAFVATWIAVYQGYSCEATSVGISNATTRTVVYSSLAILGLDFILTALMFGDV